jgi:TonB-dependent receptor
MVVRLGWAEVMARPNLGVLNPGAPAFSVTASLRTVTVGNPFIEPFRAKTTDLAWEWYFADESLLGVAYFKKDIDSFVQTLRTTLTDFSDNSLGIPDQLAIDACGATANCDVNAGTTWDFAQPRNTPGGDLDGYEVSYQQPFAFLPGFWSNFGAILNYTSVDSAIAIVNDFGDVVDKRPLNNQSETAYNATLYYEDESFSARVSLAYRDDYTTTVPGRNGVSYPLEDPETDGFPDGQRIPFGNDVEGTKATKNIDFSATYNMTDTMTLTFEGLNLTDEFDDQFIDSDADRMSYYHHTGRQYLLGVRYTLE